MKRGLILIWAICCTLVHLWGQEERPAIGNDHVPTSHPIRKTYAVGQIDISSGVSPAGARTYSVPIAAYPGVRGLNPNLALAYNSQKGNGLLGVGWSLSGLSDIHRIPHAVYYDGDAEPVGMDRDDAFMLDDMRLVQAATDTYLTVQGYIRVKPHYSGEVLQYFEASYPDGRTGIFGYKDNTENQLYYPLTELSDPWGNSITYQYAYDYSDLHYRIQEINYNGASIEFGYEAVRRADPVKFYFGGQEITEEYRLKTITCRFGVQETGKYVLSYENASHLTGSPSLLSDISYEAGGKRFNPLVFYYGSGKEELSYATEETSFPEVWHGGNEADAAQFVVAHAMGGNGEDLIASYPGKAPYIADHTAGLECFHCGFGLSDYIQTYDKTGRTNYSCGNGFAALLSADITGRGRDFLVKVNNEVVDKQYDQVTFTIYNGGIGSADFPYSILTRTFRFPTVHTSSKGVRSIQPKFYYPGDFDGDGRMEILAVSLHQPFGNTGLPSVCYVFDLENNKILYQGKLLQYHAALPGEGQDMEELLANSDELSVSDTDGDGKSEIHHKPVSGGRSTYAFDVSGTSWTVRRMDSQSSAGPSYMELSVGGDFNADGLADRFYYYRKQDPNNRPSGYIVYSKGDGTFELHDLSIPYLNKSADIGEEDCEYRYMPADVNGDGATDLIECADDEFHILLSNPYNKSLTLYKSICPSHDKRHAVLPANVQTKDGYPTELISIDGERVIKYSFQRNDAKECLVTGMANSLGVVERTEYAMMDEEGKARGIYQYGYEADYPYLYAYGKQPLVAISETYVNGQQVDGMHYYYEGGINHLTGRGFCGFTKTRTVDFKGHLHEQVYVPKEYGTLEYEYNEDGYECYYYYNIVEHSNRMVEVNLKEKEVYDNITETKTDYLFDDYELGYPVTEEIEFDDNSTRITETAYVPVSTGYELAKARARDGDSINVCAILADIPSGQEYILGRPQEQVVTSTTEDGKSVTQRTTYPQWGHDRVQSERIYLGGETWHDYQFDNQGNQTRATTTWSGSASNLSEAWTYDNYGRVTSHTSTIGTTEQYTYDAGGRVATHTDSRGNSTTYTYDEFGREKSVTRPDGTTVTTEYSWAAEGTGGLYAITVKETGQPDRKTVYDALGREVRTAEMAFDGKWRNTDTEYDLYGRIARKSFPYVSSASPVYTTYTYDGFDRPLSVTDRPGHTTTYSYTGSSIGYKVTTTENGVAVTRSYGPHGQLVQVEDPGGTTTYAWEADMQPTSITAPDGAQFTFEYDASRRCTAKNDPASGRTNYGYLPSGEMEWGGPVTYLYDGYHRLSGKSGSTPGVTYAYTPYGELASIEGDNGTSITYTYDGLGRLSSYKENIPDGKWLRKDYTYKDGQVASIAYTSQAGPLTTENFRYQNGHLVEVTLPDGTSIFRLDAENSMGQPTTVQTMTMKRQYGYDAYGFPVSRRADIGIVPHQNFSYAFDAARSNLKSRTDNMRSRTESFTYDGMNRLTGDGRTTTSYHASGRISSKSDVGTYSYDIPFRPYALGGIYNTEKVPSGPGSQEISYNTSRRPDAVTDWLSTAEFVYNGQFDRVKATYQYGGTPYMTRYYMGGCYEQDVQQYDSIQKLYLYGGYYDSPVVWRKRNNLAPELYHILRDPLGSITQVIRQDGYRQEELSYDAWGHLRNPSGWEPSMPGSYPTSTFLGRGFCGHEHLPVANLINMNARLYDPWIGMFLSPDPQMQFPDFSQGLNRYAYCMNNPLIYVDEDGEFFWAIFISAVVIGGVANVATHWDDIQAAGGGWKGFWKGAGYFSIGGLAGGVGAAAGVAAITGIGGMMGITAAGWAAGTTGFLAGAKVGLISGMASGFTLNTGNALYEGARIGGALESGLMGAVMGGATGGLAGGISGGISASMQGRNFWTGELPEPAYPTSASNTLLYREDAERIYPPSTTNSEKTYSGYYGVDNEETVRYVGITSRDPQLRFTEHLKSGTNRSTLHFRTVKIDMFGEMNARIWEQNKINQFGLQKNGGQLFNKINSIAPKKWNKFNIKY